jgi:hypothetical protein
MPFRFVHKILLLILLTGSAYGNGFHFAGDSSQSVKVFLNCPNSWCWQDYIRSQTTWAYFVQDQFVADVNLRINSLENGSGGSAYKLIFEGQRKIAHLRDTVEFSSSGIQTDNEVRDILLKHIQLGLVRYAMQTESHDVLTITSKDSSDQKEMGQGSNPAEDPFNAWVYNLNLSGNGDGQKSNRNLYIETWLSASQVKETHRLRFSGSFNTQVQRFDYEGEKGIYRIDRYRGTLFYVKSLNSHWSLGCFNGWSSSTFDNLKNGLNNSMALEYNLFPYKESQTRQLTASLFAGSLYNQYLDSTIYFRKQEWRPQGRMNIQGVFNPSWGSASLGFNNTFLLDDVQKLSSSVYCSIDARIFKGLSVSLYGSFSLIRNQINLPIGSASIDKVYLRQQVIATNYSYYFYASLNYRFGSIFNNVVNTRFQDEF